MALRIIPAGLTSARRLVLSNCQRQVPEVINWRHNQKRQTSFVPVPIFINTDYNNKKKKENETKNEELNIAKYDYRNAPLFKANPVPINDTVNAPEYEHQRVRYFVNGLANPENLLGGITSLYDIVNPLSTPEQVKKAIEIYEVNKMDTLEKNTILDYINQMGVMTQEEYTNVVYLTNNYNMLYDKLDAEVGYELISTSILTMGMLYLDYKAITGTCNYGLIGLMCDIKLNYWGWLFPATFLECYHTRIAQRRLLKDLYFEYVSNAYTSKYYNKLKLLGEMQQYMLASISTDLSNLNKNENNALVKVKSFCDSTICTGV